ncbi:MAG: glycosyltransferase family 39 protein, partial [Cyclobacteriaceae bacterium]|nr:glycosyltransferase family 39 protein [Cyclobacteriaceae bacterium]
MKKIIIFSIFWFILSLVQSYFSEIIDDEAYYWVYSQFLDWGYFDHPPMIALLIKIGSFLFPGELGVRLLPSLLGTGTIFLILTMLKDKVGDIRFPMLVICGIPLLHFHVSGFIAIPDLPLVFFASLFFFLYKKYLEQESPWVMFLLSLSIVLMLYSKYHSLLVIGFTVLSNLKILYRRSFWLVVLLSVILYLPHILW